jgi:hypothetical protein
LTNELANQSVIKVSEGNKIKIWRYGSPVKGKLEILNDSTIVIGADSILINEIKEIRFRTKFAKVAGIVTTCAGTAITIPLIYTLIVSFSSGSGEILAAATAGPVFVGIGVLIVYAGIKTLSGRTYSTYGPNRYKISIADYYGN